LPGTILLCFSLSFSPKEGKTGSRRGAKIAEKGHNAFLTQAQVTIWQWVASHDPDFRSAFSAPSAREKSIRVRVKFGGKSGESLKNFKFVHLHSRLNVLVSDCAAPRRLFFEIRVSGRVLAKVASAGRTVSENSGEFNQNENKKVKRMKTIPRCFRQNSKWYLANGHRCCQSQRDWRTGLRGH
jgi:hypothetical protein